MRLFITIVVGISTGKPVLDPLEELINEYGYLKTKMIRKLKALKKKIEERHKEKSEQNKGLIKKKEPKKDHHN